MKLPLLTGQSYTSRSVAAAAQRTLNWLPEPVEVPGEKNSVVLYGTPGHRSFCALPDAPGRGLWTGAGRLFAAAGTHYYEINSSGTVITTRSIADDATHSPVSFVANGNQLLVVSAQNVYCDNGGGPTTCSFAAALTGTCNTDTYDTTLGVLYWVTGDKFTPDMVGGTITVSGTPYTVLHYVDPETIIINANPGTHFGFTFTATIPLTGTMGVFLDGYYIVNRPNTNIYNISNINNGLTWDALDFGKKEGYPDHIQGILADHELLLLFGSETSEVHQNTGAAAFPFQRIPGAYIHQGTVAPWASVSMGGKFYWIGADGRGGVAAYTNEGFTPKRISTFAVEEQWQYGQNPSFPDPQYLPWDQVTGYARQDQGHQCWIICVGPVAWCYDATSDMWSERCTYNYSPGVYTATADGSTEMRFHCYVPEWGKHFVLGDSGVIWESSMDLSADNTHAVYRQRDCTHIYNENRRNYFLRAELDMETGTTPPATAAPTVYLSWSDDRGHTFNTPLPASAGVNADYTKRVFWPALGSSRDRVFRFTVTSKSKMCWTDATVELLKGTV